jgi:YfiH family protein
VARVHGGGLCTISDPQRFGLPSPPRWLRQVHGTSVAVEPGDDEPEADAAVTRMPGTALAILTADCLPVVLASEDGNEVAAAHAGWRGLAAGVLEATVAAMQAAPERVLAWLGPCAGPQAYEVGQDVFDAFLARDPRAAAAFVATRPGHWRVDLYALARQCLLAAGVARVHGGGLCTISDPQRFYSHRRDRRTGLMSTLDWRSLVR